MVNCTKLVAIALGGGGGRGGLGGEATTGGGGEGGDGGGLGGIASGASGLSSQRWEPWRQLANSGLRVQHVDSAADLPLAGAAAEQADVSHTLTQAAFRSPRRASG